MPITTENTNVLLSRREFTRCFLYAPLCQGH